MHAPVTAPFIPVKLMHHGRVLAEQVNVDIIVTEDLIVTLVNNYFSPSAARIFLLSKKSLPVIEDADLSVRPGRPQITAAVKSPALVRIPLASRRVEESQHIL